MQWLLPVALVSFMISLNDGCQSKEPDVENQPQAKDQKPSGLLKVNRVTVVALSHDGKKAITWDFEKHNDLGLWDIA